MVRVKNRITSYNVCYTKLLRTLSTIVWKSYKGWESINLTVLRRVYALIISALSGEEIQQDAELRKHDSGFKIKKIGHKRAKPCFGIKLINDKNPYR